MKKRQNRLVLSICGDLADLGVFPFDLLARDIGNRSI